MEKPSVTELVELKEKHPGEDLHVFNVEDVTVVFRTPPQDIWDRYVVEVTEEGKRVSSMRALCRGSLVSPAPDEFANIIAKRPGLLQGFAVKLSKIAGLNAEIEVRKL